MPDSGRSGAIQRGRWLVPVVVVCLFPTVARAAPALMRVGSHAKAASMGAGSESFTHNLTTTPKAMILWTSNQTANTR